MNKKELKILGIESNNECINYGEQPGILRTFFSCSEFLNFLMWFNPTHETNLLISPIEVLLNLLPKQQPMPSVPPPPRPACQALLLFP